MKNIFFYVSSLFLVFSCTEDTASTETFEDLSSDASAIDASGDIYEVGFIQASSNNQNPFVQKKSSDGDLIWQVFHEQTPVDGRASLVAIDEDNRVWVSFSVDGGSNENTYITKHKVENNAFNSVYMNSYGRGGGAKASILAEINPENGQIIKGTFLAAKLTNGNTNSLSIDAIGFDDDGILLETSSAAWPPGTGASYERYPNITDEDRVDGQFNINYTITYDLSEIIKAEIQ